MAIFPVYLDVTTYLANSAVSQETASLVGINALLTGGPYPAGSTALTLTSVAGANGTPSTSNPTPGWILDGLNSEIMSITSISGNTLTLASGTLAAHANGVNVATAGIAGCLADKIHQASEEVNIICQQGPDGVSEFDTTALTDRSLYAVQRTETYMTPYGGAQFNVDNALQIIPYHFPVRSVTGITVQVGAITATSLNLQYLAFPQGARLITVPYAQLQGTPPTMPSYFTRPFSRVAETYITLTYTAGPCNGATLSSVPSSIQRACMELTSDLLAERMNPYGAANVRMGDTNYMFELRGDFGGRSLLYKHAVDALRPFTRTL